MLCRRLRSPIGIAFPKTAHSLSRVQMEDDLYSSDAWKNATPTQRMEFVSKLRASKKIERELVAKEEKKKKMVAAPAAKAKPSASSRRKARKISRAERRKIRLQKLETLPAKVSVDGIDVTTNEFLSTYQWRKVRMEALKKYGPKCMCCGATPATGAVMNVDHIKPRKLFPSLALDINNLQVLCHECNHGKGNWDQTDWRK